MVDSDVLKMYVINFKTIMKKVVANKPTYEIKMNLQYTQSKKMLEEEKKEQKGQIKTNSKMIDLNASILISTIT